MNYKGIDISKWQGVISVDTFKKFKSQGISFVIIRAYCNGKDKCFEGNYKNAKQAGLNVGAYCYIYGKNTKAVTAEAKAFLEAVKGKTFEYPLYLDIEDKTLENLGKRLLTDMCKAFCDTIQAAGYYCGIYANPAWFDGRLYKNELAEYDKWLAHWVKVPKYGNEFGGLWQYGTGRLDGYSGELDMNISYRDYSTIIKNAGLNGFEKHTAPQAPEAPAADETLAGDVNGDGKVNAADLAALKKMLIE